MGWMWHKKNGDSRKYKLLFQEAWARRNRSITREIWEQEGFYFCGSVLYVDECVFRMKAIRACLLFGGRSYRKKRFKWEEKKVLLAEKFCNSSFLKRRLLSFLKVWLENINMWQASFKKFHFLKCTDSQVTTRRQLSRAWFLSSWNL